MRKWVEQLDLQEGVPEGKSHSEQQLRSESLTIGGAFTLRQSATEFLDEEFIDDKTRVLSFFGNYETQDSWGGLDIFNLTFSKGLDFLDATETGMDNLSREQGRSDFIKLGFLFLYLWFKKCF